MSSNLRSNGGMRCHSLKCAQIRVAELDAMDGEVDMQISASGNVYLGTSSIVSEEIYQVLVEDWQIDSSPSVKLDVDAVVTNITCHNSGLSFFFFIIQTIFSSNLFLLSGAKCSAVSVANISINDSGKTDLSVSSRINRRYRLRNVPASNTNSTLDMVRFNLFLVLSFFLSPIFLQIAMEDIDIRNTPLNLDLSPEVREYIICPMTTQNCRVVKLDGWTYVGPELTINLQSDSPSGEARRFVFLFFLSFPFY